MSNRFKIILYLGMLVVVFIAAKQIEASSLSFVSDKISLSWPGSGVDHTFTFRTNKAIPAGGKIEIAPDTGNFFIFPDLDYSEVDLATSSNLYGPFRDRIVSSTPSAAADGLAVTTGASSTLESLVLTLNSTEGIASNTYAQIEVGENASYGASGDRQIINASSTGSYFWHIKTYDGSDNLLDQSDLLIALNLPVAMKASVTKMRFNGQPTGVLTFGTTQTIMSLGTNYRADCRYGLTPDTHYMSIPNDFTNTGNFYHSVFLSGLVGGVYTYYIRCYDNDVGVFDTTDFIISFTVSAQPGEEGDETGTPGPGGGGSGGGSGHGFGFDRGTGFGMYLPYPPPPGAPGVVLEGWGYPGSDVGVLQDGTLVGAAAANNQAEFGAFLEDLEQGVYTFGLWAEDKEGRRSTTFSTTFWIDEGTQTTVSDVILSPTIDLAKDSFEEGEIIEVFGYGIPDETVEVWVYNSAQNDPSEAQSEIQMATPESDGSWSAFFRAEDLGNGSYKVKARTEKTDIGKSGFSQALAFAVGGVVEESLCAGADLNGDGRVNLTDFSILLFHWGTDDECADQNNDGIVDLIDFSIMLFNWTG